VDEAEAEGSRKEGFESRTNRDGGTSFRCCIACTALTVCAFSAHSGSGIDSLTCELVSASSFDKKNVRVCFYLIILLVPSHVPYIHF